MKLIKFENYNKMEDVMYYLGSNAVLKMNTNLYTGSEKYGRKSYHQEIQYYNEKIKEKVVNIKRNFDYFLSIENLKPINHIKEYIMIRQQDIFLLRRVMNKVFELYDSEFDNMYVKKGGNITLRNKFSPIEYSGLSQGKYLVFAPDLTEAMNGEKIPCIRVNLSSPDNFVYMPINKYTGLLETINKADLFGYAQNMMSYFGRPENGTNLFDISGSQDLEDTIIARKGRKITPRVSGGTKLEELE